MMIRRKAAEFEFGADGGVGRVNGRVFQVSSVLDGQDVFVGIGGIAGLHDGRLFGVALAGSLRVDAGRKGSTQSGEGRGVGIRPAFEFHCGQVGRDFDGSQNDVGPAQLGGQVVGVMEANLKFLMQFHGLAGEGELGGLARLAHAMQQRIQIGLLRGGEVAGFALGNLLAGGVGRQFAEGGGRLGEIIGRQTGGDIGIFQPGGNDEVAVERDDGNRAVWFMRHIFGV